MDWKEFFASIVNSISWPIVVVFIIWQVKDKIVDLLPRLKRLKHKDTELEFAELFTEIISESKESLDISSARRNPSTQRDFDFLMRLSEMSPRSAIIESFRAVENAISVALTKAYPEIQARIPTSNAQQSDLLCSRVLSEGKVKLLNDLRRVRNKAAHSEDLDLSGMTTEAYVEIALSLVNELLNYEP